jgi:DMSO/TMAO reductase YedYZ molybdopterin-dependent catalytic subunit
MSGPVSRGFRHLRRPPAGHEGRVTPGQYVTQGYPVLSAGPTPHTPLPEWTFSIRHGGDTLKSWTWPQFQALPVQAVTADIHCVTPLVQARHRLARRVGGHAAGSGRARRHLRAGLLRRRL